MTRHDLDFDDDPPAPASTTSAVFPQSQSPSHSGTTSPVPSQQQTTSSFGSAVWGLLRRISTIDGMPSQPPTPPPGASQLYHQNAHFTGTDHQGDGDGVHDAFTPPRRIATPRGLPSLEPLILHGYSDDTDAYERLLSRGVAEEIRTFLPERLKIMDDWSLVYSLYQHGSSLSTLYQLCDEYRGRRAGFVLVIRDGKDGVFGAYLTEAPHPAASYFGTGECFLWRASLHAPLPPPPSADTTNLNYRTTTIASPTKPKSQPQDLLIPGLPEPSHNNYRPPQPLPPPSPQPLSQSIRFQTFCYTGANDYCIFCETKFLSVGGGSGTYGLWLNDSLSRGHSAECDTFLNQPLSDEGDKFDVIGVELWVVGAT